MERSLASVLTKTLEAAQAQLVAARTLDPERLADATASRADLQFELEVIQSDESFHVDEEIADTIRALQAILEILRDNNVDERALREEARAKIANVDEGTVDYEIAMSKAMKEVKRRHGLIS